MRAKRLSVALAAPPHFWALALVRVEDYARAGVPMLPVVSGGQETRRQILLYSVILLPIAVAPFLFGYAGLAYAVTAIASGVLMIALALRLHAVGDGASGEQAAKHLFAFSVLYLFLLFAVLLVEQGIGLPSHALLR